MSIEKTNDPPKQDQDDLRLRRFTMGMGIVFLLLTCGAVNFGLSGTLLGVGLPVTLAKPGIIKLLVYLSALYALGLFCYRNSIVNLSQIWLRQGVERPP